MSSRANQKLEVKRYGPVEESDNALPGVVGIELRRWTFDLARNAEGRIASIRILRYDLHSPDPIREVPVTTEELVELRRRIGYVLDEVGRHEQEGASDE